MPPASPNLARRALLAAPLLAPAAQAQQPFPNRPLRLLVGFPPGTAADLAARLVATALAAPLGQPVVVENRPGAGSSIAAEAVVRAAPDGHSLFLGTVANTINATLQRDLAFDFARDLAPIAPLITIPNILVIHPSLPATSVAELIALGRAGTGLFFASSGIGTAPHLAGEMFAMMAGIRMTHVPYQGSGQAVTDLLAGRVNLVFSPASTVLAHVREGRLRALASTGATRSANLPTMEESGLPGFRSAVWAGLYAPAATPAPLIARLTDATRAALAAPELAAALAAQGFERLDGGPEALATLTTSETARWAEVIRTANIRNE